MGGCPFVILNLHSIFAFQFDLNILNLLPYLLNGCGIIVDMRFS